MTRFFLTVTAIYLFLAALIVVILSFYLASNVDLSYLLVIWIPLTFWLIATGVGLLLKRNWARISIFILSGMAIVLGIILWSYLILIPDSDDSLLISIIIKTIFIGITGVIFIAIPIINFIFFTRQSSRELFISEVKAQRNAENDEPMEKATNEIIKDKIFFMKWFYYYVYFSLPATVVSLLVRIKECGKFESCLIIAYSIFCTIVIIGLHRRRLWSWKLNWGLLILFTVLIPFKYMRIPYWIAMALVAYLWFFPNYIYFKKRKHLFRNRIQNTEKLKPDEINLINQ